MLQFDSQAIGNAAPINDWVDAMERALIDTADGKVEVPQRLHIDRGNNTHLLMPCFGELYFSTKLVSVFPENLKKKEPVIYGTVILNEGSTGKPLAVLDGSKLTAMRTAAVGSVGIRYLAPPKATKLGVIGLGIQGFHQALFACQQREIRELRILDRTVANMKKFQTRFHTFYPDIRVIPSSSASELCRRSEIIITATGSQRPVIPPDKECWEGKTLVGIGSYKPGMREFSDEVVGGQERIYVDTLHGLEESGDLLIPLKNGTIRREQVEEITGLVRSGKISPAGSGFYKSVGMAAFDLYGARLVYENQT